MIQLVLLFLLLASDSYALEGAEYTEFTVDGIKYDIPIPNNKARDDFYWLHKAMNGDYLARTMLLGGKDRKFIFIGDDEAVRWLVLDRDGQQVIEHRS